MYVTSRGHGEQQGRPVMLEIKRDELLRAQDLTLSRMAGLLATKPLITGRGIEEAFTKQRRDGLAAIVVAHEALQLALQEGASVLALVASPEEHTDGAVLGAMGEIRNTLDSESDRNRFNNVTGLQVVERALDLPAERAFFAALGEQVIKGAEGDYTPTSPLGPGRELAIIMDTATLQSVAPSIPDWRTY